MSKKLLVGLEEEIEIAYLGGINQVKLAEMYSVSVNTISNMLRRNNVTLRTRSEAQRVYTIDETFFDIIDTEYKSYVLGLWAADGYNNQKDGSINLTLTDEDLVRDVAHVMGTNKPIYVSAPKIGKMKYELRLNSKLLCNTLTQHGCPQCKTMIMNFSKF